MWHLGADPCAGRGSGVSAGWHRLAPAGGSPPVRYQACCVRAFFLRFASLRFRFTLGFS